jgi:uncharacterized membrane-anchored protein
MSKYIALVALVVILGLVNLSIAGKEKHLTEGKVVYLELAPVDPRSLMQGDYMTLNFQVAAEVYTALPKTGDQRGWNWEVVATDGFAVVNLDDNKVGSFVRIHDDQTLVDQDVLMRYRVRNGTVKFATNAFFFQEGHAQAYEQAKYGGFRVTEDGELLLVEMLDQDLNIISVDESLQ